MIKKHPILSTMLLVFICIILFCALFVGGFLLYNTILPKAPALDYPEFGSVDSVTITHNGVSKELDEMMCGMFTTLFFEVSGTRIQSVNDTPVGVENYYFVHLVADEEEMKFYVYEKNGRYYLEVPYVGIYETGDLMYDNVSSFYAVS